MFAIFYNKSTSKIVGFRTCESTPSELTAQQAFNLYIKDSKSNPNNLSFVEMEWNPDLQIVIGRDMYNEATGKIEEDLSYVPPAPVVEQPTT